MNYIKQNPEFIDAWIQEMQVKLYEGLAFENIDGYGRVYPLEKDKKTIPAYFISGNDYKDVLTDDRKNGQFFCVESDESDMINSHEVETEVDWIFLLDLKKLYPEITHRADAEARKQIIEQIQKVAFFKLESITTGIDALSDFDVKAPDMQPYYIVSFTGKLRYKYYEC